MVIDLIDNMVKLADNDKASTNRCTENNDGNTWGEDITMITEARQQAHNHMSWGNNYVLMFPRDM